MNCGNLKFVLRISKFLEPLKIHNSTQQIIFQCVFSRSVCHSYIGFFRIDFPNIDIFCWYSSSWSVIHFAFLNMPLLRHSTFNSHHFLLRYWLYDIRTINHSAILKHFNHFKFIFILEVRVNTQVLWNGFGEHSLNQIHNSNNYM